jgi:hypothetical protein
MESVPALSITDVAIKFACEAVRTCAIAIYVAIRHRPPMTLFIQKLLYHRRVFFPHLDSPRSPLPVLPLQIQSNVSAYKYSNRAGAAALPSQTVQELDAAYVDDHSNGINVDVLP